MLKGEGELAPLVMERSGFRSPRFYERGMRKNEILIVETFSHYTRSDASSNAVVDAIGFH